MATTIQVSEKTADELHDRKRRGDTYDDVVRRLLDLDPGERPQDRRVDNVDELDLPGQGGLLERRREAVRAAVGHLEAAERSTKQRILEHVVDEIGLAGYQDEASLWKNLIQPALHDLSTVESEGPSGRWRSTG